MCVVLAACGRPEAAPALPPAVDCPAAPTELGPGLTAARVELAGAPGACLDVVRADPARFKLRVLTAARDGSSHPAPAWRETFHLAAVINAGMFHADGTPVGLIVENGVAVGGDNKKFFGVLAFDPRSPDDPPAVLTGRDCPGFDLAALRKHYLSLVEDQRLLGCDGAALPWGDPKRYSAAAIGLDRSGRIVLLHARTAVTMTELSRALATKELDLAGALFLEGGPEASLVAKGEAGELSRVGSYETGFLENDNNRAFWWLPVVLALEPR
jgi:hypothetical protein